MSLEQFLEKYPEYKDVSVGQLLIENKTFVNGKIKIFLVVNPSLPENVKRDLKKTFGL